MGFREPLLLVNEQKDNQIKMNIRFASEQDWKDIVNIYNQAVEEHSSTADMEPITVESRLDWLKQHSEHTYPFFVSEVNNMITGWCSLSPYRPGRAALRTVAEISFYIHKDYRRKGVADLLISHALGISSERGFKNLVAILLDTNKASIKLLEKHGFKKWGHLPDIADFKTRRCGQYIYGKKI